MVGQEKRRLRLALCAAAVILLECTLGPAARATEPYGVSGRVLRVLGPNRLVIEGPGGVQHHVYLRGTAPATAGHTATRDAEQQLMETLVGRHVTVTDIAGGPSSTMMMGVVRFGNEDINHQWLRAGLLRFDGATADAPMIDAYTAAEDEARAAGLGIWAEDNPGSPRAHLQNPRHRRRADGSFGRWSPVHDVEPAGSATLMALAKALASILLPLGLVIIVLAGALWSLRRKRHCGTGSPLILAIALLWVSGSPVAAHWLTASLETSYPQLPVNDAAASQAIVVLGGGVAMPGGGGTAVLGPEANRAWFASRLFKAGKAPLIVVSGGGEIPEAPLIAYLLGQWSVPDTARMLESTSRNTRENALATRDALAALDIDRILLVTTALHMPRAAAAFHAVGFDVKPFPVGFTSLPGPAPYRLQSWTPTTEALSKTTAALLEVAASLYYRMRGWNRNRARSGMPCGSAAAPLNRRNGTTVGPRRCPPPCLSRRQPAVFPVFARIQPYQASRSESCQEPMLAVDMRIGGVALLPRCNDRELYMVMPVNEVSARPQAGLLEQLP